MYEFTDSPLVRNDKTLVLAHDHGLEHGPKQFAGVVAATAAVSTPGTTIPALSEPTEHGVDPVSQN